MASGKCRDRHAGLVSASHTSDDMPDVCRSVIRQQASGQRRALADISNNLQRERLGPNPSKPAIKQIALEEVVARLQPCSETATVTKTMGKTLDGQNRLHVAAQECGRVDGAAQGLGIHWLAVEGNAQSVQSFADELQLINDAGLNQQAPDHAVKLDVLSKELQACQELNELLAGEVVAGQEIREALEARLQQAIEEALLLKAELSTQSGAQSPTEQLLQQQVVEAKHQLSMLTAQHDELRLVLSAAAACLGVSSESFLQDVRQHVEAWTAAKERIEVLVAAQNTVSCSFRTDLDMLCGGVADADMHNKKQQRPQVVAAEPVSIGAPQARDTELAGEVMVNNSATASWTHHLCSVNDFQSLLQSGPHTANLSAGGQADPCTPATCHSVQTPAFQLRQRLLATTETIAQLEQVKIDLEREVHRLSILLAPSLNANPATLPTTVKRLQLSMQLSETPLPHTAACWHSLHTPQTKAAMRRDLAAVLACAEQMQGEAAHMVEEACVVKHTLQQRLDTALRQLAEASERATMLEGAFLAAKQEVDTLRQQVTEAKAGAQHQFLLAYAELEGVRVASVVNKTAVMEELQAVRRVARQVTATTKGQRRQIKVLTALVTVLRRRHRAARTVRATMGMYLCRLGCKQHALAGKCRQAAHRKPWSASMTLAASKVLVDAAAQMEVVDRTALQQETAVEQAACKQSHSLSYAHQVADNGTPQLIRPEYSCTPGSAGFWLTTEKLDFGLFEANNCATCNVKVQTEPRGALDDIAQEQAKEIQELAHSIESLEHLVADLVTAKTAAEAQVNELKDALEALGHSSIEDQPTCSIATPQYGLRKRPADRHAGMDNSKLASPIPSVQEWSPAVRQRVRAVEEVVNTWRQACSSKDVEVASLKAMLHDAAMTLRQAQEEARDMRTVLTETLERNVRIEKQLMDTQVARDEIQAAHLATMSDLQEFSACLLALSAELRMHLHEDVIDNGDVEDSRGSEQGWHQALDCIRSVIQSVIHEYKRHAEEACKAVDTLQATTARERDAAAFKLQHARESVKAANAQAIAAEQAVETLISSQRQRQDVMDQQEQQLQMNRLQSALQALVQQETSLQQTIERLQSDNTALEFASSHHAQTSQELRSQLAELETKLQAHTESSCAQVHSTRELQAAVEHAQELAEQVYTAQQIARKWQQQAETSLASRHALQLQCDGLQDSLTSTQTDARSLRMQLQSIRAEHASHVSMIASAAKQLHCSVETRLPKGSLTKWNCAHNGQESWEYVVKYVQDLAASVGAALAVNEGEREAAVEALHQKCDQARVLSEAVEDARAALKVAQAQVAETSTIEAKLASQEANCHGLGAALEEATNLAQTFQLQAKTYLSAMQHAMHKLHAMSVTAEPLPLDGPIETQLAGALATIALEWNELRRTNNRLKRIQAVDGMVRANDEHAKVQKAPSSQCGTRRASLQHLEIAQLTERRKVYEKIIQQQQLSREALRDTGKLGLTSAQRGPCSVLLAAANMPCASVVDELPDKLPRPTKTKLRSSEASMHSSVTHSRQPLLTSPYLPQAFPSSVHPQMQARVLHARPVKAYKILD